MIEKDEKKYNLSMIKTAFLEIWNNLHPMIHLWIVISSVGVLSLYAIMGCM